MLQREGNKFSRRVAHISPITASESRPSVLKYMHALAAQRLRFAFAAPASRL